MVKPKVAFIVFGVHKDGLLDPMGTPFIDDALIAQAKGPCARRTSSWLSTTSSWPPKPRRRRA